MHETELEREINFLRLTFQIAPTAAASAPREAASWWLVQEDTFALIARSAIILALGKYPQAVTSPRAVEKMLVENYPIPRRAASRRGFGNFWNHPRDGFVSTLRRPTTHNPSASTRRLAFLCSPPSSCAPYILNRVLLPELLAGAQQQQ